MLLLTEELGQPVVDGDGRRLGRAVELVVRADDEMARVDWVGLGRRRRVRKWAAWSEVSAYERSSVQLRTGAALFDAEGFDLPSESLLLRRDVLDAQIFDADGGRLVRVGEVVLARFGSELRVIAVQFGAGPLVRRLGLRAMEAHVSTYSIDWQALHLASGRGLSTQLETRTHRLDRLSPGQLAALIAHVSTPHATQVLDSVGARRAAGALSLTHADVRSRLISVLPHRFAASVIDHMASDHAASALRDAARDDVQELLRHMNTSRAEELRRLLEARPHSAGSLMSTAFRTAGPSDSLDSIRERIARDPPPLDSEAIVILIDENHRPLGVFDALTLITSKGEPRTVPCVPAETPIDDVIDLFATQDIDTVLVVDDDGRLIGTIAISDAFEELVAERLPGRRRFAHLVGRDRFRLPVSRSGGAAKAAVSR